MRMLKYISGTVRIKCTFYFEWVGLFCCDGRVFGDDSLARYVEAFAERLV